LQPDAAELVQPEPALGQRLGEICNGQKIGAAWSS
jgi:hypothetical protein